jgi:hypothetical protein
MEIIRSAIFSKDKSYRYHLGRAWDKSRNSCCFIGLNPSKADEKRDDNTITKCIEQARRLGFGSMEMVNLFAYIDTVQSQLYDVPDPVGPENDLYLIDTANRCDTVILMWGNNGLHRDRAETVLQQLRSLGIELYCLKVTSLCKPWHIGRIGYVERLEKYV